MILADLQNGFAASVHSPSHPCQFAVVRGPLQVLISESTRTLFANAKHPSLLFICAGSHSWRSSDLGTIKVLKIKRFWVGQLRLREWTSVQPSQSVSRTMVTKTKLGGADSPHQLAHVLEMFWADVDGSSPLLGCCCWQTLDAALHDLAPPD